MSEILEVLTKIRVRVDVTEEHKHQARLGAVDLLDLMRLAGYDVPNAAEVTFRTPGRDVEVDSDGAAGEQVVTVSWTTRTERTL